MCGSTSHVEGTFTCGMYMYVNSYVEGTFMWDRYSGVEGMSHQSEILHSLMF